MTEDELRALPWVIFLVGFGFIAVLVTVAVLISDPRSVLGPVAIVAPAMVVGRGLGGR